MKNVLYFLLLIYAFGTLEVVKLSQFTDIPPDDYALRTNLSDCPIRFYSNPPEFELYYVSQGYYVAKGEFPHMAAIGWSIAENVKYLCGGSLLSSKFILTAAHCAANGEGIPPDTIRLGDIDLGYKIFTKISQQIKIKSIQRHPQHRFSRKYFDIAIIELEKEANLGANVCPACLWLEEYAPSDPMEAIGYGATGYGEDLSATLLKANLTHLNKKVCMERLPTDLRSLRDGLIDEQFCAASDYQDTCEGDSGGPLQIEMIDVNKMVIPLIVGVVSFGTPCINGSIGVYTRVASYKKWIEHVTGISFDYLTCARSSTCFNKTLETYDIGLPPDYPINRVGLIWNETDSNRYSCGATLIDYKFALTSAFCVNSKKGFPKYITFGYPAEKISIDKVHIHPMYTLDKPENDLALLELTKYLKRGSSVLPACLWQNENRYARNGSVRFSVYSNYGGFILNAKMNQDGKCSLKYYEERNIFCANNSLKFVPNVCKMDYGGPILDMQTHLEDKTVMFLRGVISSFNKGCDKILVGTRISPHVSWIEEVRSIFSP